MLNEYCLKLKNFNELLKNSGINSFQKVIYKKYFYQANDFVFDVEYYNKYFAKKKAQYNAISKRKKIIFLIN